VAPQVSNGVTIFFVTLVLILHPRITAAIIRFQEKKPAPIRRDQELARSKFARTKTLPN
jgi:hypothetical protein